MCSPAFGYIRTSALAPCGLHKLSLLEIQAQISHLLRVIGLLERNVICTDRE